jgi:hypothetical protein
MPRNTVLDCVARAFAYRVLTWVGERLDPERRVWLVGLRAELDVIENSGEQLCWAVGGLRLLWTERRYTMPGKSRVWAATWDICLLGVVLGVLEVALLVAWRDLPEEVAPWRGLAAFLLVYFALAGLLAGRRTGTVARGAVAGLVTGLLAVLFFVLAFAVVYHLNRVSALGGLPFFGLIGAICGAFGALAARPLRRLSIDRC